MLEVAGRVDCTMKDLGKSFQATAKQSIQCAKAWAESEAMLEAVTAPDPLWYGED